MANDLHFAVVVGINRYPGFPERHLQFARNDADRFAEWLGDAAGGDLPAANVELVAVDDAAVPNGINVLNAIPDLGQVSKAFRTIATKLERTLAAEPSGYHRTQRWTQSRLYLYFSGHGLGPEPDEVAMLMANADQGALSESLGAKLCREFFKKSTHFREVLILLDCCREIRGEAVPHGPTLSSRTGPMGETFATVICATRHGALAREAAGDAGPTPGERNGHFTRALLEGLWGAAAHPVTGAIQLAGLNRWLKRRLPHITKSNQDSRLFGDDYGQLTLRADTAALSVTQGVGDRNSADLQANYQDAVAEILGVPAELGGVTGQTIRERVRMATDLTAQYWRQNTRAGSTVAGNPFLPQNASAAPVCRVKIHFASAFQGDVNCTDSRAVHGSFAITAEHRQWELAVPQGFYRIEPVDKTAGFQFRNSGFFEATAEEVSLEL